MREHLKTLLPLLTISALCFGGADAYAQGRMPSIPQIKIPTVQIPDVPIPQIPQIPQAPMPPTPKINTRFLRIQDPVAPELEANLGQEETVEERIAKLLEEFGVNARYGVTNNFIYIYDTTNYYALWAAMLCERVEQTFGQFTKYIGFREAELTEPMVVILFVNKADYEAYAKKNLPGYESSQNKAIGFYASGSNRMTTFDVTQTVRNMGGVEEGKRTLAEVASEILEHPQGFESLSVIVHEATHQVSYNRGLFNRFGKNPDWAVEGLAMLFEAPIGEIEDGGWKVETDFGPNLRRVEEFQRFVANKKGGAQFLRSIVSLEDVNGDVEGSYAASWALFTYLYKKFPRRLAGYLNYNASIDRQSYPVDRRILEFESFFTNDWNRLYQEVCAFVTAIQQDPDSFTWRPTEDELKKIRKQEREAQREAKAKEAEEKAQAEAEKAAEEAAAAAAKDDNDDFFELEDGVELADDEDGDIFGDGSDAPDEEPELDEVKDEPAPKAEDATTTTETKKPEKTQPKETKQDAPTPTAAPKTSVKPEKPARQRQTISVEGRTVDGKTFDWTRYKNKIVVVNFWATWNKQSLEEQKLLAELYKKYHDQGLEIVGYSLDDRVDTLKNYVAANPCEWTILSQQLSCVEADKKYADMSERFRVFSLPGSVVVGRDGVKIGTTMRGEKLREKVDELFR